MLRMHNPPRQSLTLLPIKNHPVLNHDLFYCIYLPYMHLFHLHDRRIGSYATQAPTNRILIPPSALLIVFFAYSFLFCAVLPRPASTLFILRLFCGTCGCFALLVCRHSRYSCAFMHYDAWLGIDSICMVGFTPPLSLNAKQMCGRTYAPRYELAYTCA